MESEYSEKKAKELIKDKEKQTNSRSYHHPLLDSITVVEDWMLVGIEFDFLLGVGTDGHRLSLLGIEG